MNGIEKIKERIFADCEAEVAEMRDSSKAECRLIAGRFEEEAEAEYERLRKQGEQEAWQRRQLLGGVAELEAKKQILALKQEFIALAFERAAEKLASLPEEDYIAFAAKLAANASRSGDETLLLSAADKSARGDAIVAAANARLAAAGKKAALTLDGETADIKGGVILRDGRIESNCSIDMLVAGCRGELSAEVTRILF